MDHGRVNSPTTMLDRHVALPAPLAARLARLAADQRGAATIAPGPVLCVAPAGSGKTTTVVARLAWRVASGTDPASICALTFNRRAAAELQTRTDEALAELGIPAGSVRVRTFHALGREILIDSGADVSHVVERHTMLQEIIGRPLSGADHRELDDAITRLKLDPERGPPPTDVALHRLFALYQAELRRRDAIDLDDLVALVAPTLRADTALLARWRKRCGVLFVDEAQDLDHAQLDLAILLAADQRDIFLVGDDDQTIYAWRLADVRRVLDLAARLPGLTRVDLETNHRCAPEIVRRAARLIARNDERFSKRIRSSPNATGGVTLAPDSGDEVARARWLLSSWYKTDSGDRYAVLARTNRELAPYAAVALELDLAYNVEDDGLMLGEQRLLDAIEVARRDAALGLPLLFAVEAAAASCALPPANRSALLAWAAPYRDVDTFHHQVMQRIAAQTRLSRPDATLTLATIHGTKGLEWDHVACIGHDDGVFPSARALGEAAEPVRALEEERRLAYVAWTRARRTLTLIYDPAAPSVFIRDAFDHDELR